MSTQEPNVYRFFFWLKKRSGSRFFSAITFFFRRGGRGSVGYSPTSLRTSEVHPPHKEVEGRVNKSGYRWTTNRREQLPLARRPLCFNGTSWVFRCHHCYTNRSRPNADVDHSGSIAGAGPSGSAPVIDPEPARRNRRNWRRNRICRRRNRIYRWSRAIRICSSDRA